MTTVAATPAMPTRARYATPLRLDAFLLVLVAVVWVILLNNSRIIDNVPNHVGYSLLRLPRESRVAEALVLFLLFVSCQRRLWRSALRDFGLIVWLFLASAVAAMALTPTFYLSQFQGIYAYLAPLLLFGWASTVEFDARLLKGVFAIVSAYVLVSTVVALGIQLPAAAFFKGDWIHGFFSDAHAYGAFLAVGACVTFSRYMIAGGAEWLLAAVVLFGVSYFPANEKMIAFTLVWWAASLGWRFLRYPTSQRVILLLAAGVAIAAWSAASRPDLVDEWFRVRVITERRVTGLGPVVAWTNSAVVLGDSATNLLVGCGPGNYAGVAAQRAMLSETRAGRVLSGKAVAALTARPKEEGALGWVTNTWANLLAEFGVIGTVFFVLAVYRLWGPVYKWRPLTSFDWTARTLFLAGFAGVLWQGCFTPYTNWSDPVLMYPLLVVGAYAHRVARAA